MIHSPIVCKFAPVVKPHLHGIAILLAFWVIVKGLFCSSALVDFPRFFAVPVTYVAIFAYWWTHITRRGGSISSTTSSLDSIRIKKGRTFVVIAVV